MADEITGDLLIGRSLTGNDRSVRAIDPSTGRDLEPTFAVATLADVNRACRLAEKAFDAYRSTGLDDRAVLLELIAANIADNSKAIVRRAIEETGIPSDRLEKELDRTVGQLRMFGRVVRDGEWLDLRVDSAVPDRQPLPRPDIRLRQVPLGPVAVFGSSNFPLAFSVAGGDTASALAAGCPVLVKGHLAHPGTSELVGRAVQAAVATCGFPEGVFSLLSGPNETGAALVRNPAVKAVGFTGSRAGGLALSQIAHSRPEPIPVYAEMSSINPVFLLPEALKTEAELLGKEFVRSMTSNAGQLCTKPGLLVAIDAPELELFIVSAARALADHVASPMLTAGIHQAFDKGVSKLANHQGVGTAARGLPSDGVNRSPAVFFETTVSEFLADHRLADEVFGASSLLVRCRNLDEMLAIAEIIEGQLTATVHFEEEELPSVRRLLAIVERKAGRIVANGWPTGVEVSDAMVHGGPFPAASDSRSTSVGTMAIRRFLRPVSYQGFPQELLPVELREVEIRQFSHLRDGVRI